SMMPGSTALTRMPAAATSAARVSVSAVIPAFDATYAAIFGDGVIAARDATFTIRPPPALRIALIASRHDRKQVTVLIRHCPSNCASVVSSMFAIANPPTTWIDPHNGGSAA